MNDGLSSLLPSALVLGAAGVLALFLTLTRGWTGDSAERVQGAVHIASLAILVQAAHFTEELLAGFHERLPELLGLASMSLRFFVSFNLAWLAIWTLCAWGLSARRRAALFPLWFLAIASTANGALHPLLAFFAGGYFPGLATSPVAGVMGILLLQRLLSVTESAGGSGATPASRL